jgi:hypothetical protein
MKFHLLKFALPIGLGMTLLAITFFGIVSTTFVGCDLLVECSSGQCKGTNGHCYSCSSGSYCTTSPSGNCSTPTGGVYCCTGSGSSGGGGSTAYCSSGYTYNYSSAKCCPNSAPYYYPGTHGISAAGCYASCPYVGDCGSQFTKY